MKYIKIITAILVFSGFVGKAQAEGFFEPGISYLLSSTLTDNDSTSGDATTDLKGFELNLTGGLIHEANWEIGLFADLLLGVKGSNDDSTTDSDVGGNTLGIHVGYRINEMMKAWFGYGFSRQLGVNIDSGTDVTLNNGNAIILGYSYKVGPVNIKGAYKMYTYKKVEGNGTSINRDQSEKAIVLGVSYPM